MFHSSESDEWYTPQNVIDLVHECFSPGQVGLDPCFSGGANERVGAASFCDNEMDGFDVGI